MADTNTGKRLAGTIRYFRFPYGTPRTVLLWPLICFCLVCQVWGLTLWKLDKDRQAIRESAFKETTSLSKGYADQLAQSVAQIDQITLNLKYYWKKVHGTLRLEEQLEEGLYPRSALLYVSVLDRDGKFVTGTLTSKTPSNGAHKDWFQFHKTDRTNALLISNPEVSRRLDKTVIRFTRKLEAADGSFDGVVAVTVEPEYLASFINETSLGKNGFVSLRKNDGRLLAKRMGESVRELDRIFRSAPVFQSELGVAALPEEKFIDNQRRIVAWQALKNYPLVSTVGLSEQEIFSTYRTMAHGYRNLAIACSIFLFLVAIIGMYFSSRTASRRQQAEKVKNAYRLATDGAREGFYMVRALYDQDHNVVDFLVEDCNERGASYYGTTSAKLVGTRFSDFPGDYVRQVIGIFRRAMETGFYEDEFQVSPESPLKAAWIHRRLVRSDDGLAVTLRDISEMKAHEEALSRLANTDAVTTLPNRHWLMNFLPTAVERAKTGNTVLALLFVDLDDFKNINDTLGHAAGDQLLQAAALRLRSVIRPRDNVVRLGGDEFTIILEQVESTDDVSSVAQRIVKTLSEPFLLASGNSHTVHASIGISMFPQNGDDGETLLKHADIAMYAVKANGKAHYQFFEPQLSENLVVRLNKEQALRKAIERDEFVLYYQPRVDTFSGELRGMEALVRWVHPELGLIPPLEFIPMAEDTGLIVKLGELVIRKACAQLAQWKAQNLPVVPVSINVSPRQFNQGDISALFTVCMAQFDIAPSLIEIEITESCMMGEDNVVTEELAAIEDLGIKLLVDDFGTGYSSLSQLQRFDLDVLKVDRAFTAQLGNGKEGEALFMAILSMAHVLGMSVVAEGVETMEQLRVLQALSCNEVQGYLISRPMPASEIPAILAKRFLPPLRPLLHAV